MSMGWECPRCHRCYGPMIPCCTFCPNPLQGSSTGTGINWRIEEPPTSAKERSAPDA